MNTLRRLCLQELAAPGHAHPNFDDDANRHVLGLVHPPLPPTSPDPKAADWMRAGIVLSRTDASGALATSFPFRQASSRDPPSPSLLKGHSDFVCSLVQEAREGEQSEYAPTDRPLPRRCKPVGQTTHDGIRGARQRLRTRPARLLHVAFPVSRTCHFSAPGASHA